MQSAPYKNKWKRALTHCARSAGRGAEAAQNKLKSHTRPLFGIHTHHEQASNQRSKETSRLSLRETVTNKCKTSTSRPKPKQTMGLSKMTGNGNPDFPINSNRVPEIRKRASVKFTMRARRR